jgi:hypothetical protein
VVPLPTSMRAALATTAAIALIAVAAAGCGGSDKPAYCSDRTNLQNSVNDLKGVTSSSGLSGLKSQLTKVQSDASALISSAKSDFPSQTTAIKSSVDSLATAVNALPSSPTAADVATIGTGAAAVVKSVKSFSDASKSKCS